MNRHTFVLPFILFAATLGFAGVNVTTPQSNTTVGAPTNVVASATGNAPIIAMQIYVDNQLTYSNNNSSVNTNVNLANGNHMIVVQAWDNKGAYYKSGNIYINVTGGNQGQQVINNIQNIGGWQSCDKCAGPNGNGHPDVHWMAQGVKNPSMDGIAAEFYLGQTTDGWHNYSNALFFNRLNPNGSANHFILDFYVYVKDPSVIQGLEMDVFYARSGKKNYFLTECDSRGNYSGTWQVSNATIDQWQHTGLPCHLNAYSWNHVTLEFLRNGDGSTNFVSVSMNGNKQYVNRSYPAGNVNGSDFEMNPAIQLDGDERQDPIDIVVDKMTLTTW